MRVLQLISSGGMYGAEAVILNLSHVLEREGNSSVIGSFSNASLQLQSRAQQENLTAVPVACQGQFSGATLPAIRQIVRDHGIDLVHAHGYKADLYAWAALRSSGLPLVSTCHTWYDNDLALRLYGTLDRRVLRQFARVVAVSAEVERHLLDSGVAQERVRRIRNGIDLQPFAAAAESRGKVVPHRLRVGLVGRLSREKGVDVFVDAAAIVAKALLDVEFVVVGEGADREELEQRILRLGLAEQMRLLGHQDGMAEVYAGLDLLVSASRQEGLPIALLEGMASGLPLVGTRAGEVPTLIISEETGLLVERGDAASLAGAMLQVLRQPRELLRMGQNARKYMEREFSADRMAAEYCDVYREAIAQANRGAHAQGRLRA